MNGRLNTLANRYRSHPAAKPIVVSISAVSVVTLSAILAVLFDFHRDGAMLIGWTTLFATLVAIPTGCMRYRDECHILAQNNRLRELAARDPLTGLLNRRAFHEAALDLRQSAARDDTPAALIAFDIDWFKQVNDTYGHEAGDLVLRTVAHTVSDALPGTDDLLARWGGEEFLIYLPEVNPDQATQFAEFLRGTIRTLSFGEAAPGLCVSVSLGVMPLQPTSNLDDALRQVDRAVYDAKRSGRDKTIAIPEPLAA